MSQQKKLYILAILGLCQYVQAPNQTKLSLGRVSKDQVKPKKIENNIVTPDQVTAITVTGLTLLPEATILSSIPYQINDTFDPTFTDDLIRNLYAFGYFKQIKVYTEKNPTGGLKLVVVLEEKTPIKEIIFEGNKHLSAKDIFKKTDLEKRVGIEEPELEKYARRIQQLYKEKNYHNAQVQPSLSVKDGLGTVKFVVNEGPCIRVKKVRFSGNKTFSDKKLRSLLLTREDWLFGFFDRAGTFNPLMCEQDRYTLEYFYQSNGFMNVKVADPSITTDKKNDIVVTFSIQEGDRYTIGKVKTPETHDISEEELKEAIPLRTGQLYSREIIRISIEKLRDVWGKQGYIYADIEPIIKPNETNKTVDITFKSEPGNKVYLNCINILGNEKTRDKVIRRELILEDGDLITTDKMEVSKNKVEHLGFFDQHAGVNWKIERLDKNTADLNLLVKEIKTGKFGFQMNFGGNPTRASSPGSGFNFELSARDRNVLGKGLDGQLVGRMGQSERSLLVNLTDPWFLDRPLRMSVDGYYTHATYNELSKVESKITEERKGGSIGTGFLAPSFFDTIFMLDVGLEKIDHADQTAPKASVTAWQSEYQNILDERFKGGAFAFLQLSALHDTRNHMIHTSRGHKLNFTSRFASPIFNSPVGFYKLQADAHWYTPIIGDNALVLHVRGHGGLVKEFSDRRIPFRELYHIGGPASVRGWEFGQIGPMWYLPDQIEEGGWQGESIGGRKGAFINTELIFPLLEDFSIKASVFYDGGSGWDTTGSNFIDSSRLKNNSFDYRHSIGIGIRLLNPQPIRIDWGFKLDRRENESLSEVHFSAYSDF